MKKKTKPCGHCIQKTLFPYEFGWTYISCGSNVIKRKHELSKIQRKKVKYINRLKYAEQKNIL